MPPNPSFHRTAQNSAQSGEFESWAHSKINVDASVICREASRSDLPQVLGLYSQPDFDSGEVLPLSDAELLLEKIRSYPDYRIYVALHQEQIVGTFALLVMDNLGHKGARSAIIEDVVVATDWRHRGVGRKMMNFAFQMAGEKGCYKALLSSNLLSFPRKIVFQG